MTRVLIWFASVTAVPALLHAQGVLVAPHAVFIDHRTRSGSFEIYNPADETVEVSISTIFGYPATDSVGRIEVRTFESPTADPRSAAHWIEAFPKRVRLGPNQRQTIRLLGSPPAGLEDGEYWTRVVVQASGARVPVTGVDDTASIKIGVTLTVRTLISLMYRKGELGTGVRLADLKAKLTVDTLTVYARLHRLGNAAYLGTMRVSLLDAAAREVAAFSTLVAVYDSLAPRFAYPVGSLPPGSYTVRVQVDHRRADLGAAPVLRGAIVRDSIVVFSGRSH